MNSPRPKGSREHSQSPKASPNLGGRPRQGSITLTTKLRRDGRKVPEHYRKLAQVASSPSQISIANMSEYYELPEDNLRTVDDVYAYRGYKKIAKIDEGAFGIVYKATRTTDNLPVALKEVDLSKRRMKRIEEMKRELFVLQKLDSKYIVKLIEHFVVNQTLVIVLEFCAGRNLTQYLKQTSLPEDEALFYFKQMATALKIMHKKGIGHRDVKLNNFLLDGSCKNVKIADFGLSVVSYRRLRGLVMSKTFCGTEPYMAPEILRRNTRGYRQYNPLAADVWALGVCLYAMLTRTFPFRLAMSQRDLYRFQQERRWRLPRNLRDSLSEELKDLLWHMLDPQPERRISISGIMAHPWVTSEFVAFSQEE